MFNYKCIKSIKIEHFLCFASFGYQIGNCERMLRIYKTARLETASYLNISEELTTLIWLIIWWIICWSPFTLDGNLKTLESIWKDRERSNEKITSFG